MEVLLTPHSLAESRVAPPGSSRVRSAQPLVVSTFARSSLTLCPALPLKVSFAALPGLVTFSATAGPLMVTVALGLTLVTAAAAWPAHPGRGASSARAEHPMTAPARRPASRVLAPAD